MKKKKAEVTSARVAKIASAVLRGDYVRWTIYDMFEHIEILAASCLTQAADKKKVTKK